jgi:hypothetical protein
MLGSVLGLVSGIEIFLHPDLASDFLPGDVPSLKSGWCHFRLNSHAPVSAPLADLT